LDKFGERGSLLSNLDRLLQYHKEATSTSGQDSLFGDSGTGRMPLVLSPAPEISIKERLSWEKELLGLFISGHPLDAFREKLEAQKNTIKKLKESSKDGEMIVVGGILTEVKPYLTKNGENMLFTKIADLSDTIEMAVFPRTLKENPDVFAIDQCIAVKAKVTTRNNEKSLIAEKAKRL